MGECVLGSGSSTSDARIGSVEVVSASAGTDGTHQHALAITSALRRLLGHVRLSVATLRPAVREGLTPVRVDPDTTSSDLTIFVGLWWADPTVLMDRLAAQAGRIVLIPTVYSDLSALGKLPRKVDALWYVSWDQALATRSLWAEASSVDVLPCAVDTSKFGPIPRASTDRPVILCRHSRDAPEKFSADVFEVLRRLNGDFDLSFRILGGTLTLGPRVDPRVQILPENGMDVSTFLNEGQVWFYSHAEYWRETACVAMLEAMACGLPVVVSGQGGMREYLVHGTTGFACVDIDEMVDVTRLLLRRRELRVRMGAAARKHVVNRYGVRSMEERLRLLLVRLASH